MNISEINKKVQEESLFLQDLRHEIAKVIVGQEDLVEKMLVPTNSGEAVISI